MEAMPHLVEMHKKHADKGLVVITVSVDPPDEKEMIGRANAFLRKIESPFRNLHMNEPTEFWNDKLGFNTPPCYYVFDRQGKWVRFRATDYRDGVPYAEMDKVIMKMLNE
jgi:hypothetical protein